LYPVKVWFGVCESVDGHLLHTTLPKNNVETIDLEVMAEIHPIPNTQAIDMTYIKDVDRREDKEEFSVMPTSYGGELTGEQGFEICQAISLLQEVELQGRSHVLISLFGGS
jgi:hypothetical protein